MNRIKHNWRRVPNKLRRTLVLIAGLLLIVLAGIIGAVPGPGGTIIFLLAITVLASEFAWALRLRDRILEWVQHAGVFIRRHPVRAATITLGCVCVFWLCAYVFYNYIR
jgi:hypothetical protein